MVVIEHSNEVNKRCSSVYQLMWLSWVKDMAALGYADGWTRLRIRLHRVKDSTT